MSGYMLMHCEVSVVVWVDGSKIGVAQAGEYKQFVIDPAGDRIIKIESLDGTNAWEQVIHFPEGLQKVVQPVLRPTDAKVGIPGTFTDGDQQSYRTTKIGSMEWMAQNFRRGGNKLSGAMYRFSEARSMTPQGWRLPSRQDFINLTSIYPVNTFNELVTGRSGFTAQLNGVWYEGAHNEIDVIGYLWSSTLYGTQAFSSYHACRFNKKKLIVEPDATWPSHENYAISVRYCRDLLILDPLAQMR